MSRNSNSILEKNTIKTNFDGFKIGLGLIGAGFHWKMLVLLSFKVFFRLKTFKGQCIEASCNSAMACPLSLWLFLKTFCPKSIWDESQVELPRGKKSEKLKTLLLYQLLKLIYCTRHYFFRFVTCWYLKWTIFFNTFWTKFFKNGHCALLRYLYWTKSNSV